MFKFNAVEMAKLAHTFVGFMVRDNGFTAADAKAELNFLLMDSNVAMTKDYYLTARRTGLSKAINRAQRAKVYMTFENAINHITF